MLFSALVRYLTDFNVEHYFDFKIADLVSFRVGGCTRLVIFPKTENELVEILLMLKGEKFVVLGKGTNCYFSSDYYDGVIVSTVKLRSVLADKTDIYCQCGASIATVCKVAYEKSLSGIEFAYGIPGSIGGAVYINASAYGGDFSQIVCESTALDMTSGKVIVISNKGHCFGEKHSIFFNKELIILETKLTLRSGDKKDILDKMNTYIEKRKETQPLNLPSAGSTFVKPRGFYASQLIDKCGLKGLTVGGAQVSTKHAGFIVNIGGATSYDVQELIKIIKDKVYKAFNVLLTEEVIYIE